MMTKGYAETSLTDLAKGAKMTVSHLLYYYPSKEQVLLELSDQVNERVLSDVTAYRGEPPEERIHVLADNVFIRGAIQRSELSIVREIVALSIHRPELRERLSAFSTAMIGYLEDLFEKAPRRPGLTAIDAAEIAGALWMGLLVNADYDERLSASRARRLFRQTLFSMANLPDAGSARPVSKRARTQRTPAAL